MKAKTALIFTAGVVIGALSGFMASREHFRKHYAEVSEKEIESIRELYSIKRNVETVPASVDIEEMPKDKDPVEKIEKELYSEVLNKVNYSKVSDEKVNTMTEQAKKDAEEITKNAGGKFSKKFSIIDEDAYFDSDNAERLIYYSDGVLADEELTEVDPKETIGASYLKEFKKTYDTMYVHNFTTDTDYMVEFSNASYYDLTGEEDD